MIDNIVGKYLQLFVRLLPTICFVFLLAGCSGSDDWTEPEPEVPVEPETPVEPQTVDYEVIREYTFTDLKTIETEFKKELVGTSLEFLSIIGSKAKYAGDVQLRAYKVAFESEHTDSSGAKINLSGVLIVPPLDAERSYRQVIAPPYTYVMKEEAPTVRVAEGSLEPHLIFWMLEAYVYGYALLVPDYAGFGDSYGQCYIPYVEKNPMVRTTIEYVDAAQSVLEKEKYEPKDGLIISGYSLGAYVALQVARELETNASYEDKTVDLLFVGGAPCNLLQEANLIRASASLPQPYLLPLALLGYQKNGYPHLAMGDYLKAPYASEASIYLDGQHDNYTAFFPKTTSELFTDAFMNNEKMDELNRILDENSVKTWANSCRFIMTHGEDDETVYYEQARDFAAEQAKSGGSVSFSKTSGTHTGAGAWFFFKLYVELISFEK